MCQDIDAMWDAYLTQRLIEHEKRCEPEQVTNCENCLCGLYEGDEVYKVDGCYYCDDCIVSFKEELEKK